MKENQVENRKEDSKIKQNWCKSLSITSNVNGLNSPIKGQSEVNYKPKTWLGTAAHACNSGTLEGQGGWIT